MHDVGAEDVDVVKLKGLKHTSWLLPSDFSASSGSCFVSDEMVPSSHL